MERALKQVEAAFAGRSQPRAIPHCTMCYKEDEIARFLSIPYPHLTVEDLRPILWNGYMCWGTWPEIAYYVPRLLEFYYRDAIPDEEQFYAKLLLAVRPELGMRIGIPDIGEKMTAAERSSVFQFVMVVLEDRLVAETEYDRTWILLETLAFLTAFEEPIEPLLTRLAESDQPRIRANFCLLLAEMTLSPGSFSNAWMDTLTVLPENEKALDRFFSASYVVNYLLLHVEEVSLFGKEAEAEVAFAFDWAMAQLDATP